MTWLRLIKDTYFCKKNNESHKIVTPLYQFLIPPLRTPSLYIFFKFWTLVVQLYIVRSPPLQWKHSLVEIGWHNRMFLVEGRLRWSNSLCSYSKHVSHFSNVANVVHCIVMDVSHFFAFYGYRDKFKCSFETKVLRNLQTFIEFPCNLLHFSSLRSAQKSDEELDN